MKIWLWVVLVLAAVVFFWPPQRVDVQPVLERRAELPTKTPAPLESGRPQRPPHPVEIYYPPGR